MGFSVLRRQPSIVDEIQGNYDTGVVV